MSEIGSGLGSSYPTALDTDTNTESTSTTARADVPNDLAAGLLNIQSTLGIQSSSLARKVLQNVWLNCSNWSSLNAAISAIGGTNTDLYIPVATSLGADTVVPGNVRLIIPRSGSITLTSAQTLDIQGDIVAGNYPIFTGFTAGNITVSSNRFFKAVNVVWFGAVGDASTDDYTAFNAAVLSTGTLRVGVYVPRAEYAVGTQIVSTRAVNIFGDTRETGGSNVAATIIKRTGSAAATEAVFKLEADPSAISTSTFKNIAFDANGTSGYALWLANVGADKSIKSVAIEGAYLANYTKYGLYIDNGGTSSIENSESWVRDTSFYANLATPDYHVELDGNNNSRWNFENCLFGANSSYKPANTIHCGNGTISVYDCRTSQLAQSATVTDGYDFYVENGVINITKVWSESDGLLYHGSNSASRRPSTIRDCNCSGDGVTANDANNATAQVLFNSSSQGLTASGNRFRGNVLIGSNVNNDKLNLSGNQYIPSASLGNVDYISGTQEAGTGSPTVTLVDNSHRDLYSLGVAVGQTIYNVDDGSFGVVRAIADDTGTNDKLTIILTQGTNNQFNDGDEFRIYTGPYDDARNVGIIPGGYNEEPTATYYVNSAAQNSVLSGMARTHRILLAAAPTGFGPPNKVKDGDEFTIVIINDSTAAKAITWDSVYKFTGGTAPTLTATAHSVDIIKFQYLREYGYCETYRALDVK